jgi:phospholipid/cholesterol/gamma-HCH transport system substrate-binding protein
MEKDANYFRVGVFVSAALLCLGGFIIWLMGSNGFKHYDRYTVYFTDPVSGLNEDGIVKYKGVDVGKIVHIRISPDRANLVKVDVEVKGDTPVRAETKAEIQMQGITGQSYIELSTESLEGKPPQVTAGERYPVLQGSGSQLAKFFNDMPALSKQLITSLGAINDFSRSGAKTADSIRALTDQLKEDPSQIIKGPSNKGVVIPK